MDGAGRNGQTLDGTQSLLGSFRAAQRGTASPERMHARPASLCMRRRWRHMRQLTTEAEATAAVHGTPPDAEAALVAVAALDPKTTGEGWGGVGGQNV